MDEPLSDEEIGAIRARADGLRALATRVMCGDDDLVANPHLAIDGAADDIDRLLAAIDALRAVEGERDRRVAEAASDAYYGWRVGNDVVGPMLRLKAALDLPLAAPNGPAEGKEGR